MAHCGHSSEVVFARGVLPERYAVEQDWPNGRDRAGLWMRLDCLFSLVHDDALFLPACSPEDHVEGLLKAIVCEALCFLSAPTFVELELDYLGRFDSKFDLYLQRRKVLYGQCSDVARLFMANRAAVDRGALFEPASARDWEEPALRARRVSEEPFISEPRLGYRLLEELLCA